MPKERKEKPFDIKEWVVWTLRRATLRLKARSQAIAQARTSRQTNPATGRLCWFVRCIACQQELLEKECRVDHIEPFVPVTGWTKWKDTDMWDFTPVIYRLILGKLQVMCKPCHQVKSNAENAQRRAA